VLAELAFELRIVFLGLGHWRDQPHYLPDLLVRLPLKVHLPQLLELLLMDLLDLLSLRERGLLSEDLINRALGQLLHCRPLPLWA